ncbi:MAG: FecR domain-containing protein [Nitrospiraceae bacterium]|nr:FecR domain-containing protein [Nitrospiraceae bacterium]
MLLRLQITGGIAAALALVLMGVWWWTMLRVEIAAYRTGKGEQRTIALSDGSNIQLNTDTALVTHLASRVREMVLQHGEAIFTVAHESRPFHVLAGTGRIRDLGTQFSVLQQSDRVVITVLDGSIEVSPDRKALHGSRKLHSGDRVSYTRAAFLSSTQSLDLRTAIAWREGKLLFEATPLSRSHQRSRAVFSGRDPAR